MKTVRIATITVAMLFLIVGHTISARAGNDGEKVLLEKSFDINANAKLEIDHEFGEVICRNWDKNTISVRITAKYKAKSESQIQEMIDKVEMDVHGDKNNVVVHCRPGHKNSKGNSSLSLILEIQMPKTISLELSQKFGFAMVETIDGPTKISSEYGSIQLGELNNTNNKLQIEFGSGSVKHLTSGTVRIAYSDFELETAGTLSLESEYSNASISQKIKSLSADVEGGNLEINKIADLMLEAKYSNIEIDELSNSLSLETDYGSVEIDYVPPGFESLSIENEFGSVDIAIDEAAAYTFEAETEFGDIEFPDKNAEFSYKKKTSTSFSCQGSIGGSNPKSSVSIESNYGSVTISN